jgi:hypothetical protein
MYPAQESPALGTIVLFFFNYLIHTGVILLFRRLQIIGVVLLLKRL